MFKKTLLIVLIGLGLLATASYYFLKDKSDQSSDYPMLATAKKTIYINEIPLTVEIADEPQEQMQGLSGREKMADNKGMLFIFPKSFAPSFWMKDMKFSLDIIWIDENGFIVAISKNVSPNTYPATFSPSSPVKYVLEVNAGWSDKNNIKEGGIVKY